jgi:F0F1-type ATP synthase epsilon subunit
MVDMRLSIRTPDTVCYDGTATRLSGASELGELQIYPGHSAMTATIGFSRLVVERGEHSETFFVRQGFLHTDPTENRTTVLAISCQKLEEMEMKTLHEYREFTLEKLRNRENLNEYQISFLEESQKAIEAHLSHVEKRS